MPLLPECSRIPRYYDRYVMELFTVARMTDVQVGKYRKYAEEFLRTLHERRPRSVQQLISDDDHAACPHGRNISPPGIPQRLVGQALTTS